MFSNLDKAALIEPAVVDSILSYAQMRYPREAILLLKGKGDKHKIVVNDTPIPPLAIHGNTFPIVAKRDMFGYFGFQNLSFYINFELKNHAICHLVFGVENLMATSTFNV